jgi:hypothetical protein
MTEQTPAPELEAEHRHIDAAAEYKAFCVWAKNWLPHSDPPSTTSHLFDAWMGSLRASRPVPTSNPPESRSVRFFDWLFCKLGLHTWYHFRCVTCGKEEPWMEP